jgi:hypothetical protein
MHAYLVFFGGLCFALGTKAPTPDCKSYQGGASNCGTYVQHCFSSGDKAEDCHCLKPCMVCACCVIGLEHGKKKEHINEPAAQTYIIKSTDILSMDNGQD